MLAVVSTTIAVQLRRSIAERIAQRAASLERSAPDRRPLAAVVVNPTKVGDVGAVPEEPDRGVEGRGLTLQLAASRTVAGDQEERAGLAVDHLRGGVDEHVVALVPHQPSDAQDDRATAAQRVAHGSRVELGAHRGA